MPQLASHRPASWRWPAAQALLLLIGAAVLFLVSEHTRLDLEIARRLYDPELGRFPLRHQWLLDTVLYHGMKQASSVAVAGALYFCYLGWKGELAWLPRRNAVLAALGMLLIPLGTTLLKGLTHRYCPWDLADFGGFAPYLPLFAAAPEGIKAGECFPAGHASAGYLWIVWGIALRPAGARLARLGLLAGLGLGSLMGLARMIQAPIFFPTPSGRCGSPGHSALAWPSCSRPSWVWAAWRRNDSSRPPRPEPGGPPAANRCSGPVQTA